MSAEAKKKLEEYYGDHYQEIIDKTCACCGEKFQNINELLEKTSQVEVVEQVNYIYIYGMCSCGTTLTFKTKIQMNESVSNKKKTYENERLTLLKNEIINDSTETPRIEDGVYQLLYVSFASDEVNEVDIHEIVSKSQKRNLHRGITGAVLYADGVFLQLIEGKKEDVLSLFERIRNDSRHHNISIVLEKDGQIRLKPKAAMQLKKFAGQDMRIYDLVLSWNKYRAEYGKYIQEENIMKNLLDKFSELLECG